MRNDIRPVSNPDHRDRLRELADGHGPAVHFVAGDDGQWYCIIHTPVRGGHGESHYKVRGALAAHINALLGEAAKNWESLTLVNATERAR